MYEIFFHPKIKDDLSKINKRELHLIKNIIEEKLETNPLLFGKHLRKSLKNHRTLRVGKIRIIFKISSNSVYILAIGHREKIYSDIFKRL